jgi:hypothetical protein
MKIDINNTNIINFKIILRDRWIELMDKIKYKWFIICWNGKMIINQKEEIVIQS